jgi:outer membrane protein assembly factor BamB
MTFSKYCLVVCVLMSLFTVSCTKGDDPQPNNTDTTPPPPPPPPPPAPAITDTAATLYISGGSTPHFWAINASNGSVKWSKTLPALSYTSPLFYNNRIYVACQNSKLYAYDTSGNQLWNITLPGTIMYECPVIGDGRIYMNTRTSVVCIDPVTGAFIWTFTAGANGSAPITYFKGDVYCEFRPYLYRIDGTTGQKKWEYQEVQYGSKYVAPLVTDSLVYHQRRDGSVGALKTATGAQAWITPFLPSSNGNVAGLNIKDNILYVLTRYLGLYNATTGAAITNSTNYFVNNFNDGPWSDGVSPLIVDSLVIVPGYYPEIYRASNATHVRDLPSSTGGVAPESVHCNGVTVVGDICYYTTRIGPVMNSQFATFYRSFVYAVNYRTGAIIWRIERPDTDPRYNAPVAVARSGRIYRGGRGLQN